MNITDIMQLQAFMRSKDWDAVYSMLDNARNNAATTEDIASEVYWRLNALAGEQRYEEALRLLQNKASLFNCQCLIYKQSAQILMKLGQDQEALEELSRAPIEEEMEDYYGLAIDAKFLYLYLLAKGADSSVRARLCEIPDDYRHITMGGKFLTKVDIVSFLK